jgi:hypothetical protein
MPEREVDFRLLPRTALAVFMVQLMLTSLLHSFLWRLP